MLGVFSVHSPIRGEFAKKVREMLIKKKENSIQPRKQSKWTIEREF